MQLPNLQPVLTSLFTSLMVGACAPELAQPNDLEGSSHAEVGTLPEAHVSEVTCEGDLCPPDSISVSVSEAGDAFTTIFSDAIIAGEAGRLQQRTARVGIDVLVPAGYQISSVPLALRGAAMQGEEQGFTVVSTRTSFAGASRSRSLVHDLSADADNFVLLDRAQNLWSPTCSSQTPTTVRLNFDVTAWVFGQDRLFALDTIDGGLTFIDGLEWRRCGQTSTLRPPPAEAGKVCGGLNAQTCTAGLACEYTFEVSDRGECVDPGEVVPPQPAGEFCGGYRDIPCAEGLVCQFASERSIAERRRGACTPAIGGEGDSCGGFPEVPCAEELTCFQQNMQCVHDTGEFKSPCGEGLTACQEGLVCNGSYCAAPSAAQGEACGGPLEIRCKRGLVCQDGLCQPK
jgi:hypothetical protein